MSVPLGVLVGRNRALGDGLVQLVYQRRSTTFGSAVPPAVSDAAARDHGRCWRTPARECGAPVGDQAGGGDGRMRPIMWASIQTPSPKPNRRIVPSWAKPRRS